MAAVSDVKPLERNSRAGVYIGIIFIFIQQQKLLIFFQRYQLTFHLRTFKQETCLKHMGCHKIKKKVCLKRPWRKQTQTCIQTCVGARNLLLRGHFYKCSCARRTRSKIPALTCVGRPNGEKNASTCAQIKFDLVHSEQVVARQHKLKTCVYLRLCLARAQGKVNFVYSKSVILIGSIHYITRESREKPISPANRTIHQVMREIYRFFK